MWATKAVPSGKVVTLSPSLSSTWNFSSRKKDLCWNCAVFDKSCCVNEGFEKCVECVRSGRECDLAISPTAIKRIHSERLRLKKEAREARAKLSRLEKQLD